MTDSDVCGIANVDDLEEPIAVVAKNCAETNLVVGHEVNTLVRGLIRPTFFMALQRTLCS